MIKSMIQRETESKNQDVTPPVKPIDLINNMIHIFAAEAQPLLGVYGDDKVKLMDEKNEFTVILIIEGSVDIWRNHDELLVATVSAPGILGMQGSDFRYQMHTFRRQPASKILFLPRKVALEIIKTKDIMEDMITYQSYMNDQQTFHDYLMINSTSYEIICRLLTELSQLDGHQNISVEKYILTRTRLARSGVLKMISNLRYGGFIEMQKGKLIRLGAPFPKNY